MESVQSEIALMKSEIASMKSEMASMKGDIKDLIRQIASMGADIKSLINHTNHSNKIVDERLAAIEARQRNAAAVDGADTLCPVPHRGKPAPAAFPTSRDVLRAMTVANLDLFWPTTSWTSLVTHPKSDAG
jgi:hypothetical protein